MKRARLILLLVGAALILYACIGSLLPGEPGVRIVGAIGTVCLLLMLLLDVVKRLLEGPPPPAESDRELHPAFYFGLCGALLVISPLALIAALVFSIAEPHWIAGICFSVAIGAAVLGEWFSRRYAYRP